MTLINKIVQNVEHKVLNAGNSVSSKVEQHAAEKTENKTVKQKKTKKHTDKDSDEQ